MNDMRETEPAVVAFTMSEAARFLNVTPTQIDRLIEQGRLLETEIVAGKGRYVAAESVRRYKEQREEK